MHTKIQDDAFSPAIATVLIVLIVVVLAAVVAAVALGMANGEPDYVVGLTVRAVPSGNDAVVTLYGSRNIQDLVRVKVIDGGSLTGKYVEAWNGSAGTAPVGVPLTVKDVARPAMPMNSYPTTLWVKGTFADGTEQVLIKQAVTFMDVGVSSGDDEKEESKYTIDSNEWGENSKYCDPNSWNIQLLKGTLLYFKTDGHYVFVNSQYSYDPHKLNGNNINDLKASDFLSLSGLDKANSGLTLDMSDEIIRRAEETQGLKPENPKLMDVYIDSTGNIFAYVGSDVSGDKWWQEVGKLN